MALFGSSYVLSGRSLAGVSRLYQRGVSVQRDSTRTGDRSQVPERRLCLDSLRQCSSDDRSLWLIIVNEFGKCTCTLRGDICLDGGSRGENNSVSAFSSASCASK